MDMNWRVDWTTDCELWEERWFNKLADARDFAQTLESENEENREFMFYASRLCTVNVCDFLDSDIPEGNIRIVGKHC